MKTMDHNAYPKSLKRKSDNELRYIIKDCQEALKANPESENSSYYSDEICYCATELHKRKKQ